MVPQRGTARRLLDEGCGEGSCQYGALRVARQYLEDYLRSHLHGIEEKRHTGVLDELERVETDVPNETENEMTDEEEEIPCDFRNDNIMDAMHS